MPFPVGENIGGYVVQKPFTVSGGGGQHSEGEKGGSRYHLKTPDAPKLPAAPSVRDRQRFEAYLKSWQRKVTAMRMLPHGGEIVPVVDVLTAVPAGGRSQRVVIVSPFHDLEADDYGALDTLERITFMASAAYQLMRVHEVGLIHSDIKPTNLLPHRNRGGTLIAKLLDFDGSYFLDTPPGTEEYTCDPVYVAPEAIAYMNERRDASVLGRHVDVFSLGVMFGRLWGGEWPGTVGGGEYPSDVLVSGTCDPARWLRGVRGIPAGIPGLVAGMVNADYTRRLSARIVDKECKQILLTASRVVLPRSRVHPGKSAAPGPKTGARKGAEIPVAAKPTAPARAPLKMKGLGGAVPSPSVSVGATLVATAPGTPEGEKGGSGRKVLTMKGLVPKKP